MTCGRQRALLPGRQGLKLAEVSEVRLVLGLFLRGRGRVAVAATGGRGGAGATAGVGAELGGGPRWDGGSGRNYLSLCEPKRHAKCRYQNITAPLSSFLTLL